MKHRRRRLSAALLAGAVALSACTGTGDPASPAPGTTGGPETQTGLAQNNPSPRGALERGGTLTLPMDSFPTNFNAWHIDGNHAAWGEVTAATDPRLYQFSPTGEATPRAEYLRDMPTVRQRDGRTVITYRLNPKAVWNDGTKIDWRSFEATRAVNARTVDRGGFNNITTVGYQDVERVTQGATADEVVVTMRRPFHPVTELFVSLIHPRLADRGAFNTLMKDAPHPELRSGPYTIASVDTHGRTVTLTPNPRWWGQTPLLDRVVFRQLDPSAELAAFSAGEISRTRLGDNARSKQVSGVPNTEIRSSQRLSTSVYVFNTKTAALSDLALRKAVWQGIDRAELARVRFNGTGYSETPPGSALLFSFQPGARDNLPAHYDPAAAEATLVEAGYVKGSDGVYAKNGRKAAVKYTAFGDDALTTALARTTQTQLHKVGIQLDLDVRPRNQFGQAMQARDFELVYMTWSINGPSPVPGACQVMCSDSPANQSGAGTAVLDARIDRLGQIGDQTRQVDEINTVEAEWLKFYPQLPLWHGPDQLAYRKGLANYGPAAFASLTPRWEDVGWVAGSEHD